MSQRESPLLSPQQWLEAAGYKRANGLLRGDSCDVEEDGDEDEDADEDEDEDEDAGRSWKTHLAITRPQPCT